MAYKKTVALTPEQITAISAQVDTSGKVDKVTGSSLVPDTEIVKIHTPGSDNQDLSELVVKETGKSLVADTEISKIHAPGSDNQVLPSTLAQLSEDATHRLVTDTEKSTWNGKQAALISGSNLKTVGGNSLLGSGDIPFVGGTDPFTRLTVSGDKPTGANTTPVTLGVSFNYEANSKYLIDFYMMVAPGVAGTGCGFLIDVSTAVTYVGTFTAHQLAASGTLSGGSSIGDLGVTSQGVSSGMVGTGSNFVSGSGFLITGANAGTATFFFRSETTAVTTCKSGSVIRVMKV